MSYLMMALGDGNAAATRAVIDASEPYMTAAGATSVRGSAILTGANTGKALVSSVWDSPDGYFDNRASWLADPKVVAAFGEAGITSTQVTMAEITAERGTCEGKYGVGVFQTGTDFSQAAVDQVVDAVEASMIGQGANGLRTTRILTGENTGMALGVFFIDSLSDFFGTLPNLLADADMVAGFQRAGLVTQMRSITQTI
ncbi:MAG TPA: hypothetical protein QF409_07320 [Acidimicrobiales bacterium]|jgi:hypothetical protein|nr:hypothetical protein [Acidimicrobiales bacterium]|tara:strand:+ start:708 stop:1304 length:597 start_codon:yes stop_codon:yes gene_type:complete